MMGFLKTFRGATLGILLGFTGYCADNSNSNSSSAAPDADKAWKEVVDASKPPALPPEMAGGAAGEEQRAKLRTFLGERSRAGAEKAREFYSKYPKHANAAEAKEMEKRMLKQAIGFGDTNAAAMLEKVATPEEKTQLQLTELHKRAMAKQSEGLPAVLATIEEGTRELLKSNPKSTELWQQFILVANNSKAENATRILKEVLASENAPESVKKEAQKIIKRFDAIGQPFEMAYTALDGREVDVQKMKGKVVLIDFWATWCGPCIAELPHVKETFEKYHDKGFEIVGVSLDQNQRALERFVDQNEMPWPQYFDGKGWGNRWAGEFNINSIPAMYLVDKKGLLRDVNARDDLDNKVKKLLDEK